MFFELFFPIKLGMYQHDLSKTCLEQRLVEVIQECVNVGGVDVNSASAHLLQYVAGLNESRAKAIVTYRELNGPFRSVDDIRKVKGIGAVSFKNAAGFLRVYHGGTNILDVTAIHPEHYEIVQNLLRWAVTITDDDTGLPTNTQKQANKGKSKHVLQSVDDIGSPRIKIIMEAAMSALDQCPSDIIESIERSCDINSSDSSDRSEVRKIVSDWAKWLSTPVTDSTWVSDVAPGIPPLLRSFEGNSEDSLENGISAAAVVNNNPVIGAYFEGIAKNVVPFGVFVDIGNGDGLLHKSKFAPEHANLKSPSSTGSICKLSEVVVGMRLPVFITGIKPPNRIELGFSMPQEQNPIRQAENNGSVIGERKNALIQNYTSEHNGSASSVPVDLTSLAVKKDKKRKEITLDEDIHKIKKRKRTNEDSKSDYSVI